MEALGDGDDEEAAGRHRRGAAVGPQQQAYTEAPDERSHERIGLALRGRHLAHALDQSSAGTNVGARLSDESEEAGAGGGRCRSPYPG